MRPVVKIQVLACDVCGSKDEVKTWRITSTGQRPVELDLCTEHGQPIADLLSFRHQPRQAEARLQVTSSEELNDLKRQQARRGPRKA